jgi:hypothetical protein
MSALFDEDQQHYDPTTNELLIGGKVYIGDVNVNPIDNPKAVYSVRALTGAALAQPLIIGSDGRVATKGWTSGKYSYQINSSADVLKYQELDNGVDVQVGNSLTTNSLGVNDITVTGSPTITELVDGQAYVITVPANNTGSVTLKIDTTAVTSVRKNYNEQLVADDLKADQKLILLYNGTDSRFEAQILTKSPGIDDQATATRVTITDTEVTFNNPIVQTGTGIMIVRDEKSSGTDGGTFTSGAWRTRTLNDVTFNTIAGASLGSDQITLPAGTYLVTASAPAYNVNSHILKLANITDTSDQIIGSVENAASTDESITRSVIDDSFVLAGEKVFELQHQCDTTRASRGFGLPAAFSVVEVYAKIKIEKIG